jgi:two-component sensor histidine kinase
MDSGPVRILLVEDNPGDARLIREALNDSGARFELEHVETLGAALEHLAQSRPGVILLDLSLPDAHGLETFLRAREGARGVPIIVLTGLDDEELASLTVQEGAQDYLIKGELDGRFLARSIRYAIERAHLLASEREKSEQLTLAVREAHHRIKNNLQAISDLLYLALSAGCEGSAAEVLRQSVERIQSMALVHDLLSRDEDVQTVNVRTLAERLVPMALQGAAAGGDGVALEMSVPSVLLSSKKATTLALILNELVSNAAKHALKDRNGGRLQISLQQAEEGLVLRVRDDGPGLPGEFDLARDASVGLQVVRTLAERDLGGKLTLSSGPGLTASVWFPW